MIFAYIKTLDNVHKATLGILSCLVERAKLV